MAALDVLSSRPYIVKDRGFCPNPIAVYGIPEFADSLASKKVVGTANYLEFWEEEIDRCVNGYTTGGLWIPGRYYFYLNYGYITTVGRGYHLPDYVDSDYYYFRLVEDVKAAGWGIITLKARRRGASEKAAKGIIGHGLRFTPEKYKAGIVAGLSTYTDNLFLKVKELNNKVPPEFRMQWATNNSDELIYDYQEFGTNIDIGSGNMVMAATMNSNPNVLKSNYFNDVIYDEAGEFNLLIPGYGATKDSFMVGNKMVGTPYIMGTGGNIKSQSKGFSLMWHHSDDYKLAKLEIYGQHLMIKHFIGSRNEMGNLEEDCPNLYNDNKGCTRDQLLGCEDTLKGLEQIEAKKKELAAGVERQPYFDYLQNMPTNSKEAFLKFSGNPFNPEKLSLQSHQILINDKKYRPYKMEWKRNAKGEIVLPLEIEQIIELPYDTADDQAILILDGGHPIQGYHGLDVAGIDSYDLDQSATSKSLGAMVIKRRNHAGAPKANHVVCLIRQRPPRKEVFFENCLKASVYFRCWQNTLIDVRTPGIIEFYKNFHGKLFLAKRPQSFESEYSEQMHEFGIALTTATKPLMLSSIQTYVEDHYDKIWFPQIVAETSDYDTTTKDVESDWDATDALGIALLQEKNLIALHRNVVDLQVTVKEDPFALKEWGNTTEKKNPLAGNYFYANGQPITDHFMKILINQYGFDK